MKRTVTSLKSSIDSYSALSAPLSIDPELDGGLKRDILETLNNKATNSPYLKMSLTPSSDMPASNIGLDGEYFVLLTSPVVCFLKSAGTWNAIEKTNDMLFYYDSIDGIRSYHSFSDSLESIIQIHSIDFGNPGGDTVKYTPQNLTNPQKIQARLNIDAASQAYIDNAIAALKNSGAIGSSLAGSVMPWFGTDATIPQDWAKINVVQTWYSKVDFEQLYIALGGENNPFGLTPTTFSIPYFPAGTSIVQSGGSYARGINGGEETHLLTSRESGTSAHNHKLQGDGASGAGSNVVVDRPNQGAGFKVTTTNSVEADALDAHNNMPPYSPAIWIIKLKNTGGSFTAAINENGHLILTFDDGSIQDAGEIIPDTIVGEKTADDGWHFKKGAIFNGQASPFPTGLGDYVAHYFSTAYNVCRSLAYNGTAYKNYALGALITAKNKFSLVLKADGKADFGNDVSVDGYVNSKNTLDISSEKTTPLITDSFGLWDTVTSTFKKLSLSNLLTYLHGFFVGKLCYEFALDSAIKDASTGDDRIGFFLPVNLTLTQIYVEFGLVAAEGLKYTVDVKKNGVTIFTTLLTIDSTEFSSKTAAVPYVLASAPTTFLTTDRLSVDIKQVGSTVAGKLPILYLIGYETI